LAGRKVFEDEVEEVIDPQDDPVLKQILKDAERANPKMQHASDANPATSAHQPKVKLGLCIQ